MKISTALITLKPEERCRLNQIIKIINQSELYMEYCLTYDEHIILLSCDATTFSDVVLTPGKPHVPRLITGH